MFQALYDQSPYEQDATFRSMEPDILREPNGYLCLPNIDPDIFQRFCDFLYQGVVPEVTPSWVMEQKLYKLADLLGAHELMNRMVDALQDYQLRTNTHFKISQVRSICWDLSGSGVWNYCISGIAYQLTRGMYGQGDLSFDLLCKDYPEVSDNVILEVKNHANDFHNSLDYRQRGRKSTPGFGPCKFHVHLPGARCTVDEFRDLYREKVSSQRLHYLGNYAVQPSSVKSEDSDQIFERRLRPRGESGAAQRRRRREEAARTSLASRVSKVKKVVMPPRRRR